MTNGLPSLVLACDNLTISHNMLSVYYDLVAKNGAGQVLKRIDFSGDEQT